MTERTWGVVATSELVMELEREYDAAQERIQELEVALKGALIRYSQLEQQLAALTRPSKLNSDECERWLESAPKTNGLVVAVTDGVKRWYPQDAIRHLWPHIEAAIKGGAK